MSLQVIKSTLEDLVSMGNLSIKVYNLDVSRVFKISELIRDEELSFRKRDLDIIVFYVSLQEAKYDFR